jgi:hypothetical protein
MDSIDTFFSTPGLRLVTLGATGKFISAEKKFRVKNAQGHEVVDLAAIFDDEAARADSAKLTALSATATPQLKPTRVLVDGKLTIDLGALLDNEAAASGLSPT